MRRLLAPVALSALLVACGESREPPPTLVEVPAFELVDQTGAAFSSEELRGKVWVADFIFTSCPDVCPVLSTQLANVGRHLEDVEDLRLVSITVDPETDTPEVLAAYAERHGAEVPRWRFLTGPPAEVRRVIQEGFHLPVGARSERPEGDYDIMHGQRFILVDQRSMMRGLYEARGPELDQLEADARYLAGHGS